jgi:putative copper export protein/methionine-rich copper-binding protein CopC
LSRSSLRGIAPAALLLLLLSVVFPHDAAAHQRLLGTEPTRDAVAAEAPRELRLRFNEPVQLAFTQVVLIGPDGQPVALGSPGVVADSMTVLAVPIEGSLLAGGYTVRWSTASRDGHPVRGEYTFSIAENAAGLRAAGSAATVPGERGATATAPGQTSPPPEHHVTADVTGAGFQADSPGYVLVRWATYLALVGLIGAVAFSVLVLGYLRRRGSPDDTELIADSSRRAAGVGLGFAALLLLVNVARLYAQSLAMHGPEHVLDGERVATLLGQTIWGWGWLIQAGATLLAAVGFSLARGGRYAGWAIAAVAGLALAVTPALSGHAATMSGSLGLLVIAADALHVLAAGGWLGGLLVLLVAGLPAAVRQGSARRGPAAAALVRAFSPTALLFASLLVLTGIFAAVIHSSSLDALLGSRYGTLLLIKLGIFMLVFGIGAYNFLRVRPALGDDTGTTRLRRSAGVEIAVGAAVLLVTAMLVATARPYEEPAAATEDGGSESGIVVGAR